tara:strand:+ start:110 stop:313 length:204 start_codon:yes stop_codon:yes gene_type:complete
MSKTYLKETYSDDKITVSDVDIDAMHKHISSNDASIISEIIFDALVSMDIEHCGLSWNLEVSIEQEK